MPAVGVARRVPQVAVRGNVRHRLELIVDVEVHVRVSHGAAETDLDLDGALDGCAHFRGGNEHGRLRTVVGADRRTLGADEFAAFVEKPHFNGVVANRKRAQIEREVRLSTGLVCIQRARAHADAVQPKLGQCGGGSGVTYGQRRAVQRAIDDDRRIENERVCHGASGQHAGKRAHLNPTAQEIQTNPPLARVRDPSSPIPVPIPIRSFSHAGERMSTLRQGRDAPADAFAVECA